MRVGVGKSFTRVGFLPVFDTLCRAIGWPGLGRDSYGKAD